MATVTDDESRNDTTKLINDWRESWIKEIDLIARSASQEPDQSITEVDLNYRLQESLSYSFEDDVDDRTTLNGQEIDNSFYIGDSSRQQSEASDITSTVGQALVIKQHPSCTIKCYKDPAGVMAISDNQLAYVDFVWNRGCGKEMKMHVVSNIVANAQEPRSDRIIDFPYVGERVRVVDMDYWPTHDRYVLAVVQTGEERASWHYLFNPSANDNEQAFERWMNCQPGDTIMRVCCTAQTVYEIVNHYSKSFVLLLNVYGITHTRKPASVLFPSDATRYDSDTLRLIDICGSPSNKHLAVAYNCAFGSAKGPVGVHIFDPTNDWMLLGRFDLGRTDIQYYMPRLMYLNKVDLFVALHTKNGNFIFYNARGEQVGKRSFIWYAEEFEENQPHLYPVNVCAEQNHVAIRFSRYITTHRIND
jgi:hypothetical protein